MKDMTANQQAKWTPETDIMEPYLDLEPQYEVIYTNENKHNLKVVKVKLKNNVKFILKHLKIKPIGKSQIDNLFKEYRIGNILGKLINGIVMSKDIKKKETKDYMVIEILIEYGGSSLNEVKLKKGDTMNIACQLLSILTLMEELGLSHLDIKPLNIVWDERKNQVKLIDFGAALMFFKKDNGVPQEVDSKKILEQTRQYAAPEIREKEQKVIPQKLDVYSFGITFLKLLAAEYEIKNLIEYDKNSFIKKLNIEELKQKVGKEDMDDDLWEEIYKTIQSTPQSRPTFRELRKVFLKQAKGMTEDDYLLNVIDNLNDHSIKIKCTNNVKLLNVYANLMALYMKMENYNIAIKPAKKYLETCRKLKGESSFEVGCSYLTLAYLHLTINKKEEVRSYLEKGSSILSKMDRKNNPLLRILDMATAWFYIYLGNNKKFNEQLDKALKIKSEECDADLDPYNTVIQICNYMGSREKMEELCNKLLNKAQKEESIQDRFTMNSYANLGFAYFTNGNYRIAKESFNKALSISISNYRDQNSFLILVYWFLGIVNYSMNKFDEAIEAVNKGLSISLAIYGERYILNIFLYRCKALVYEGKGDYIKSVESCEKCLNISLREFGSNHLYTLSSYLHLGKIYGEIRDFITAKSCFSKALDIAKVINEEGTEDLFICCALGRLAFLYEGDVGKSIYYWKRALDIKLKTYDEDHPDLLVIYVNLVLAYYYKLDFQEVTRLCEIGLKIALKTGTRESEVFRFFSFNLGSSHSFTGNKESGIKYFGDASKTSSNICGEKGLPTIDANLLQENFHEFKGNDTKASKRFKKFLETISVLDREYQGYQGANLYKLFYSIGLGQLHHSEKDYSNAKKAYEEALEISLNLFGELNFMTIGCFLFLGELYVDLENDKEAENYLDTALNIQLRTLGETHFLAGIIYSNLGLIYKRTNRDIEGSRALYKAFDILTLYPR